MRKGTIAAKALTLLLAVGMLSQNVVTVYADEPGGGEPSSETTYTITYQVEDSAQGSVRLNKDDAESKESATETVTVTTDEEGNITYSEIVGVVAEAAENYTFVNWTLDDGQAADMASFTPDVQGLSGDVTYTAHFEAEAAPQNDETGRPDTIPEGKAYVVSTNTVYDTLDAAMTAAGTTDTIYLGKGTYSGSSDANKGTGANKNLRFIGESQGETVWNILDAGFRNGGDGYCDYSFDNRGQSPVTVTFENMTMVSSINVSSGTFQQYNRDTSYLRGLVGIDHLILKDCIFNGIAGYWGYTSTEFDNVTFNAPGTDAAKDYGISVSYSYGFQKYDYSIWTYTGSSYTFDGCTFNSKGRQVNVFSYNSGECTINYNDCTVNASVGSGFGDSMFVKTVLNIDDSSRVYKVNITGDNIVNGLTPNSNTCSRLFEVKGNEAVVTMGGTTVWTDGKMVSHEMDIEHGSYNNGKASGSENQYTEGYKDNAYTITYGDWYEKDGLKVRDIIKECDYCGWTSNGQEKESETIEKDLPADILIDTGDGVQNTEHEAVVEVRPGQSVGLVGALKVSAVTEQMNAVEAAFPDTDLSKVTIENLDYGFTAVLTIPDGMTLPEDVKVSGASGLSTTFTADVDNVDRDNGKVTVKFSLTDDAKSNIKTYTDLREYVKAAGVDGWITVTIPDVTIDTDVEDGKELTVCGTVEGTFQGTAKGSYTTYTFPYTWTGVQDEAGKDAVAGDDDSIRLTVKVVTDKTTVEGTVAWDDADDKDGVRPDSVVVRIYSVDADGNKTEVSKVTSADGTFVFKDLPVYDANGNKIVYSVSEDTIDEYTTTIDGDAEDGFTIVNKHTPADAIVVSDPPVKKVVKGDEPSEAGAFSFTIKANEDGNPMPGKTQVTIKTKESDTAEFGDITFTKAGTYSYTIREIEGDLDGYTYDDAVYVVTYKVSRTAGAEAILTADRTITKDGVEVKDATYVTFTNTYEAPKTPDKDDDKKPEPNPDDKKPTPDDNKKPDPSDGKPHKHHDKSSSKPVTPAQTTPTQTPTETPVVTPIDTTPAPAADVVQESGTVSTDEAAIKTGDNSMMAIYGALFLTAAAGLVVWTRKGRVR